MLVQRRSMLSGETNTLDIPVTEQQLQAHRDGMLIQHAMPNLSPDEREFIKTGITKAEWDKLFI